AAVVTFMRRFVERADWTVQKLILHQVERFFNVALVVLGEPAVQLAHQLPDDGGALGVTVLREPGDHRTIAPARPLPEELLHLLLNNCLGRTQMLAALSERLFLDGFQIVDIEHARAVAVVDARVEIAGYGDVDDHDGPATAPRQ